MHSGSREEIYARFSVRVGQQATAEWRKIWILTSWEGRKAKTHAFWLGQIRIDKRPFFFGFSREWKQRVGPEAALRPLCRGQFESAVGVLKKESLGLVGWQLWQLWDCRTSLFFSVTSNGIHLLRAQVKESPDGYENDYDISSSFEASISLHFRMWQTWLLPLKNLSKLIRTKPSLPSSGRKGSQVSLLFPLSFFHSWCSLFCRKRRKLLQISISQIKTFLSAILMRPVAR